MASLRSPPPSPARAASGVGARAPLPSRSAALGRSRQRPIRVVRAIVVRTTTVTASAGEVPKASRRYILSSVAGAAALAMQRPSLALEPAKVRPELAPQGVFDVMDPELRAAASLLEKGLTADNVQKEEAIWSEIITKYGSLEREWVPDISARAYGNRGNARSRQGRLEESLGDFDQAIRRAPYAVDPVLNRGVVLENLGRFEEAEADYRAVLDVAPDDPAAWNNLGNVDLALGRYEEASLHYGKAVALAPEFAFAAANQSIALFQAGKRSDGLRQMRSLLRRYPGFDDVRAALAAGLWLEGLEGDAEAQWDRVDDPRYKDRDWVRNTRRWPPALVGRSSENPKGL